MYVNSSHVMESINVEVEKKAKRNIARARDLKSENDVWSERFIWSEPRFQSLVANEVTLHHK